MSRADSRRFVFDFVNNSKGSEGKMLPSKVRFPRVPLTGDRKKIADGGDSCPLGTLTTRGQANVRL